MVGSRATRRKDLGAGGVGVVVVVREQIRHQWQKRLQLRCRTKEGDEELLLQQLLVVVYAVPTRKDQQGRVAREWATRRRIVIWRRRRKMSEKEQNTKKEEMNIEGEEWEKAVTAVRLPPMMMMMSWTRPQMRG